MEAFLVKNGTLLLRFDIPFIRQQRKLGWKRSLFLNARQSGELQKRILDLCV